MQISEALSAIVMEPGGEIPIDKETWKNKGSGLYDPGKYDEAIEAFDESIRMDPENKWAWYNKGSTLYDQGKYDEANQAFDEAIRLKPDSWAPWLVKSLPSMRLAAPQKPMPPCPRLRNWDMMGDSISK